MVQRAASTYRAAIRNAKRKSKHIKPVDPEAGITPRPKKVKKHVVPSRKEKARGLPYIRRGLRDKEVTVTAHISTSGYRSKQKIQETIRKVFEEGVTSKSLRKARQDRKKHHRETQARKVAGKKTASKRSS